MVLFIIAILSLLGFVLSFYAYTVERRSENGRFKAACDINDRISCTKAFSSKYGKVLGASNSLYGMFFYILMFILASLDLTSWTFYLSIASFIGTIYLIYALLFKVKTLCLVCISIYVLNTLLLIASIIAKLN